MPVLRDIEIVKKYSQLGEILQLFFDIPAKTSVTLIYTPPKGFIFYPEYSVAGDIIYYYGVINAIGDGIIQWNNIRMSSCLQHIMDCTDMTPIRKEFVITLINTDNVAHTVDALIVGHLIPEGQFEECIKEVRGEIERGLLIEIRDLLKEIKEKIK